MSYKRDENDFSTMVCKINWNWPKCLNLNGPCFTLPPWFCCFHCTEVCGICIIAESSHLLIQPGIQQIMHSTMNTAEFFWFLPTPSLVSYYHHYLGMKKSSCLQNSHSLTLPMLQVLPTSSHNWLKIHTNLNSATVGRMEALMSKWLH